MGTPQLVITEQRDRTLIVTLNKPDKLNALSPAVISQLVDTWSQASDPSVRAVVLTGAGRGFCAGSDLDPDPTEVGERQRGGLRLSHNPMLLQMAALGKPIIAAVNGAAAGAGISLACAADLRIASTSAKFVPAFIKIGVIPDMGASYHVPRILGYDKALAWLLRGDPLNADQALELGLVSSVVEPDVLVDQAVALAEAITIGTPSAVRLTKQLLREAANTTLAAQLDREVELQSIAIADPERALARARVAGSLGQKPTAAQPTPA